ncbi:uncharacterized protein LOC141908589 [Tubulanus polymorphus]|uniref:uncharacterized protein LOC141908589 n=1 Tax=Tubulanus polymorphus TaxID=672921 RepID=UPI003DA50C14
MKLAAFFLFVLFNAMNLDRVKARTARTNSALPPKSIEAAIAELARLSRLHFDTNQRATNSNNGRSAGTTRQMIGPPVQEPPVPIPFRLRVYLRKQLNAKLIPLLSDYIYLFGRMPDSRLLPLKKYIHKTYVKILEPRRLLKGKDKNVHKQT